MDTTVSITNSRETELQFDISVEGVDVTTMEARFVIEADGVQYSFKCNQGDEAAKWVVLIPAMSHLKHGEYDFHIEIITNGYYFNPYHGKVNVTPEPTVSKSEVKNDKPKTPVVKISKPEVAKDDKKPAPVISEDEPKSDDLIDAFMKHRKDKPRVEESAADKAVKAALKEFKKKPLKESAPKKKAVPTKLPKKKTVKKKIVENKEPKQSNLASVIENIDTPKDKQAKTVLDIINSIDKGKE